MLSPLLYCQPVRVPASSRAQAPEENRQGDRRAGDRQRHKRNQAGLRRIVNRLSPMVPARRAVASPLRPLSLRRSGRAQVIDDRQYRSHHACRATLTRGKPLGELRRAARSGAHHAGRRAGGWFGDGMRGASARWNVVAQQTLMAELDRGQGERHVYWADGWDGYPMARRRLLDAVAASPVQRHAGAGRRRPFLLGGRPQARLRLPGAGRRDRVRRRLDHLAGPGRRSPAGRRGQESAYPCGADAGCNGYGLVALEPRRRRCRSARSTTCAIRSRRSPRHQRFVVEAGRPGAVPA